MSEINANIVVEQIGANILVQENALNITPEDISLRVFAGGFTAPGGNPGEVQYNNSGILAGNASMTFDVSNTKLTVNNFVASSTANLGNVGNVTITGGSANFALTTDGLGNLNWSSIANSNYANFAGNVVEAAQPNITSIGTLTGLNVNGTANLGNVSNVKILGGNNAYYLQTDGSGNLTWAQGTANVSGNGTASGANGLIQLSDGTGNFTSGSGFSFDVGTNALSVPGNVVSAGDFNGVNGNLTGNLITSNANITNGSITNLSVANANVTGNLITANIETTSNILTNNISVNANISTSNLTVANTANLGNIANVKISGGVNGQFIQTDGNGNLSYANAVTTFSNVANINVDNIFIGKLYLSNAIQPGNTINLNTNVIIDNWVTVNTAFTISAILYDDTSKVVRGLATGNIQVISDDGFTWSNVGNTPFTPTLAPMRAGNNIVIFRSSTNNAAYSTNNGNSWTNVALPTNPTMRDIVYGNGVIIITTDGFANFFRSSDNGVTYSNVAVSPGGVGVGYRTIAYGNNTFITPRFNAASCLKSTDGGNTWSNIALPDTKEWTAIAYGNSTWSIVGQGSNIALYSTDDGNTWANTTIANFLYSDMVYVDGYFVAVSTTGNISYSNNGINWNTGNTGSNIGGFITYNSDNNRIFITKNTGNTNVVLSNNPYIKVLPSNGNTLNANVVPNGTYKNLGGIEGNVGAMWIRTA